MAFAPPQEGKVPTRPGSRRAGLSRHLFLLVAGSLGALFLVMVAITLASSLHANRKQAAIHAGLHVAYLQAELLTLSPDRSAASITDSFLGLRQTLRRARPDLEIELITDGMTLGGKGALTPLQQRAAAAVRAAPTRPYFEIESTPGGRKLAAYAALAGDPSILLEVRFPVAIVARDNLVRFRAAILMGVLVLLIGAGLFVAIRWTTARATRLARAVALMTASKDFSAPLEPTGGNDEISDLGASVEALVRLLRDTLATLDELSGRLASAGEALTVSAAEQETLLDQQSRFVREAVSSAEEIKQTSETAAERAGAVLAAADLGEKVGEVGGAAVRDTLQVLGDIRDLVGEMDGPVAVLADRARQLTDVTVTVKEVAGRSTMLALNAAIEAVRSGEWGKGFAPVAREMRSLADQSIRASEQVRETLEQITSAIRRVSAISGQGKQRIEAGLGQLARSGDNLRELAQVMSECSRSAREIATAVRAQNTGIVQIARALADQDEVARQTSEGLNQTRASALVLRDVTAQVKDLFRGYRLGSQDPSMGEPTPLPRIAPARRIGLSGRLTLCMLGTLVVIMVALGAIAPRTSKQVLHAQVLAGTSIQVDHLRAALGHLPRGRHGLPTADSLRLLRQNLGAIEPELGFELIAYGATLEGGDITPLQRQAEAAIRAAPGQPFLSLGGPAEVFTHVVTLGGDPSILLEVHAPAVAMTGRSTANLSSIAFLVAALLLGTGTSFLLRRVMLRITRFARSVVHLVESRDFSTPFQVPGGNDEISELGVSVAALAELLRSTLGALRDCSGKLAAAGQALTACAAGPATLDGRHAGFAGETVTSVEDIRRSSEAVGGRAEAVLAAVEHVGRLGQAGDAALWEAQGALEDIRKELGETGEQVGLLAAQARQIVGITHVVKNLADSSSMVALNAAIEADRSGKQGKGFATVAQEMRSLADQSILATERVRGILEEISGAVRQVTAISASGSQRMGAGLDQLMESGASLREMVHLSGESSRSAKEIARAVQAQISCVARLHGATVQREQLARRMPEGLGRTRESARVLEEVTTQVRHLLHGYRL